MSPNGDNPFTTGNEQIARLRADLATSLGSEGSNHGSNNGSARHSPIASLQAEKDKINANLVKPLSIYLESNPFHLGLFGIPARIFATFPFDITTCYGRESSYTPFINSKCPVNIR